MSSSIRLLSFFCFLFGSAAAAMAAAAPPPETSVYLSWESTVYPDGGMYEGLMKEGQCHGTGVFQYADGDR